MNDIPLPSPRKIAAIIAKIEKLESIRQNLLGWKNFLSQPSETEISIITWLINEACQESKPQEEEEGEILTPEGLLNPDAEIISPEHLFTSPFGPPRNKMERQLSNFSIPGLLDLTILLKKILCKPKYMNKEKVKNLQVLAESEFRKKKLKEWQQQTEWLITDICKRLSPWTAYFKSRNYDGLAALESDNFNAIYSNKNPTPDPTLKLIIEHLQKAKDKRETEIEAEEEQAKAKAAEKPAKGTVAELASKRKKDEKPKSQPPKRQQNKIRDIKKRFSFRQAQARFGGKDLGLPAGADLKPVEILKKLVKSFGNVVPYKELDKTSANETAEDHLRGKICRINTALRKHKVPCKIKSRKWEGYFLTTS